MNSTELTIGKEKIPTHRLLYDVIYQKIQIYYDIDLHEQIPEYPENQIKNYYIDNSYCSNTLEQCKNKNSIFFCVAKPF